MTNVDLQNALRAEALKCADAFYDAATKVLTQQLSGLFGGRAPAALPPPSSGRRRRSPEEIEKVLASIVELLEKHPQGLRLEGLRAGLKLDNKSLAKAIHLGLSSDQLTKKGDRRTTTYFVAPAPSKAQAEGRVKKRRK